MFLSIFKKLGLGEAKPTLIFLILIYNFVERPKEIMEDTLLKLGIFICSKDFIFLNIT